MGYSTVNVMLVLACSISVDRCLSTTIQTGKKQCIPIQKGICSNAPYNQTMFPNLMGHVDFAEAKAEYLEFQPLIEIGCSDQLEQFLCFLYLPVCTVIESPIPVCRTYCEEAVTIKCRQFLQRVNMKPKQFECDQYPSNTLCINKDNTISDNNGVAIDSKNTNNMYDGNGIYEETMESAEDEINVNLFLLVSNGNKLQLLDISAPNKMDTITLYSKLPDFTTIDYYKPQNYIYWASSVDGKIYRGTRKLESLHDIRTIVDTGIASVDTLAVDWHLKVLFWTEIMPEARLRTSSLSGRQVTTILSEGLQNPISLTLDPLEGKLFWIDRPSDVFVQKATIESYSIVTNRHSALFSISAENIQFGGRPTSLIADIVGKRLYFIDARSESLYSLNYDGSDFRLLIDHHTYLQEPGNLVVHAGHLIWSDRRSIIWANKTTGKDILVLKTFDNTPPQNIKIYGTSDRSTGKTTYDKKTLDKRWQELSSKENMADKDDTYYYDDDDYDNDGSNKQSGNNKNNACYDVSSSVILSLVTFVLFIV